MTSAQSVLFDVDGTLIDALDNQRRVWHTWARHHGVDPDETHRVALRTRPRDTFAALVPHRDPDRCLELLRRFEDEDARSGVYRAFAGAAELLTALTETSWALVTSNYEHRVRSARPYRPAGTAGGRRRRSRPHGKPDPAPYLLAAELLGVAPADCLVVEDTASGVAAGLAAGMTVWAVNTAQPLAGAHRCFPSLAAAAEDILRHCDR